MEHVLVLGSFQIILTTSMVQYTQFLLKSRDSDLMVLIYSHIFNFLFLKKILMFIFEKETEHEQGRGRERGRQNSKQAPGAELSTQSLKRGSNSRTHKLWDHDLG